MTAFLLEFAVLATVTMDATAAVTSTAASPWVETAVGVVGTGLVGLIGWLIQAAIRKNKEERQKAADNATKEERERNERVSLKNKQDELDVKMSAATDSLRKDLTAQISHCSSCHAKLDSQFGDWKTDLALLKRDLEEIKQMLFVLQENVGITPRPRPAPGKRYPTGNPFASDDSNGSKDK